MKQERLGYLDMAKGIGIFLVILGHIEYIEESTLRWIFSFHMPLFFVVGGFLACRKREDSRPAAVVLRGKAKSLLLPYASFSLMLLSMNTAGRLLDPDSLSAGALLRQYVDSVTGYGVHILWFLPAYFIAGSLFFLLSRNLRPAPAAVWTLLLAGAAFLVSARLGLDQYALWEKELAGYAVWDLLITLLRGLLAMPFLLAGWYLAVLDEKLLSGEPGKVRKAGCFFCSLLLLPGAWLALKSPVFDLHYLYVKPVHYVTALLSCTGLLCLLRFLPESRILSWLGRNSLVIMCTHAAFFVIYYISLGMFFINNRIPLPQPVFNLGVAVLVCAAEIPIVSVFNRYFGYLLGRSQ